MENYVGQRLAFDGQRCTVRFVGVLVGHGGFWIGVEWDDGSRGKNDGCVRGHRYFLCKACFPNAMNKCKFTHCLILRVLIYIPYLLFLLRAHTW